MRIVLAAIRYPPAPGGAEAHVAALAEGMVSRGHEVDVFTTDLFSEVPFRRDARLPTSVRGVRVHRFPARTLGGDAHWVMTPAMALPLARAAREADIVHAHSYGYHPTLLAAGAARLSGKPFVFTPHYHPPWSMEGGARRGRLRAVYDATLGPWSLAAADAIVAVSSEERKLLRDTLHRALPQARVIPNGIHLARFAKADGSAFRARHGLGDAPVVLYAGRLAKNKSLPDLVRAVAVARRSVPDARLVLAGQDQDQLGTVAPLAASLGVPLTATGHVPDAEYADALAAGTVFAIASEYEAFGIVLLEAMACSVPVVATRVGGVPDVVADGEDGLLVPHAAPEAMGAAIARLLADAELRRRLGERGRVKAAAHDWGRVVGEVEGLYRELLAS